MSVKCLKCGYEMSTYQEVTSALSHLASGIFGSSAGAKGSCAAGFLGGLMNQKVGTSEGVKCPKCGEVGRWEDK